jgi:hypothetical protein
MLAIIIYIYIYTYMVLSQPLVLDNKTVAVQNLWYHLKTGPSYQSESIKYYRVRVMVFNATFNNISVISWQSDLSVEDQIL